MKTLKWLALGAVVLFVVVATGAILALNSEGVHREIEARVREASGFDVSLGKFRPAFPLRLGVGPSKLSNPALDVEWDLLSVSVNRFWPPFGLSVDVARPRITQRELPPGDQQTPSKAASDAAKSTGGTPPVPPLKLALTIRDGEVNLPAARISALNITFVQSYLMRSPAALTFDGLVKAGPLPAPLPVHVETSSLTFTPTSVSAQEIDARVAGVVAKLNGASDLEAEKHDWSLKSDAPDLSQVPRPDAQVESWRGAVRAEIKVSKVKEALDADGFVDVRDVVATLRAKPSGAEITGDLRAAVDLKFAYHGGALVLPKGQGAFDLTNAAVTYGALFKKPKGTPLELAFDARGDGARVTVTRLAARLSQLKLDGRGQAAATKPFRGRVDLDVAPVELEALAGVLPTLTKLPARGRVSFKGGLEGPLADPAHARLVIDRAALDGPLGLLSAKGLVDDPTAPKGPRLNLEVQAAPLVLSGVRAALPTLKDLVPDGEVRARVKLDGVPALAKPWPQWPLDVSGEVTAKIPEYAVKTAPVSAAKTKEAGTAKGEPAPAAAGFLPKGYLTEHLRLRLAGDVAKVHYDKLTLLGAAAKGEVANARFRGEGSLAQIFGGTVRASGLDVPLVDPRPVVAGEVQWTGLVIEQAVGFAKPEFKDFANGRTTGRARFKTRLPGDPDFIGTLEATGDAAADPVTLNSVKLGEIANQSLGKIPGVSLDKVKMTPLHGQATASFNVAKGVAELPGVMARDVDNSEIKAKGRVRLADLNGDLNGTFAWANSPVKGCMAEGNSDDKHRLLIPVVIKGDLMHPGISLVGDTLKAIGAKALECEGKKLIERAQKDGVEGLKKEAGKVLKGLFGR